MWLFGLLIAWTTVEASANRVLIQRAKTLLQDGETALSAWPPRTPPGDFWGQPGGKPAAPGAEDDTTPVLFFWAVGAKPKTMTLVKKNIVHARRQLKSAHMFLVHYDLNKSAWTDQDQAWYDEHVTYSAEHKGHKFKLMQDLLAGSSGFDLSSYRWVWALDEDIDFGQSSLSRMIAIAEASKAFIVLPALIEEGDRPSGKKGAPVQQPHKGCQYHYSPYVEIIFPLLQAQVLKLVLEQCDHCIHNLTAWGLDGTWCKWSARMMDTDWWTGCAIIDETPVTHMNLRTLYKYKPGETKASHPWRLAYNGQGKNDRTDAERHHDILHDGTYFRNSYNWIMKPHHCIN